MKALFVHDHKFFLGRDGDVYSSGKLPYRVWQRYLSHFDELTVIARCIKTEDESSKKMDISSGAGVSFVFVPDIANPLNMLKYGNKVIRTLKNEIQKADAVIIRTSLLGQIASAIADKMDRPAAVEVVGCPWDAYWNYGSVLGRLYAPVAWLLQKKMLKKSDFAIYVSRAFLQKRYPCDGVVAGVSNVEAPAAEDLVLQERLEKVVNPASPFVFGIIASLESKYKGIQTLLAALASVRDQLPIFELRILGGGDPGPWQKEAVSYGLDAFVKFEGTLPGGAAVFSWLDDVDVYVQPSFQEGLPRALVEAMSRGCPCIGSTAGGIPELLDLEILHAPGDVVGLARLIVSSLEPEWRSLHAKKNFETSKLYCKEKLDEQRDTFWRSFFEYASSRKGLN